MCSLLSPSVIQWDAATVFMEAVTSQILKNLEEEVMKYQKQSTILKQTNCSIYINMRSSLASCCVEAADRSEYGAAAGRTELRNQRSAHPVLRAQQHLRPLPVCRPQTTVRATSPLQGWLKLIN